MASQTFPNIIMPQDQKYQPTISSSSPPPINKQTKLYKLELPAHYTIYIPPTYDNIIIIIIIIIINNEKCNVLNNSDLSLDFTCTIHQIIIVPTYINYD